MKTTMRPIRMSKLAAGSTCTIFAEPSRGITRSSDNTVWVKEGDNTILVDANNPERCAILYPEDLVVPLSRPPYKKDKRVVL